MKTTINVEDELWRETNHYAIDHQLSFTNVVTKALTAFLKAEKKGEKLVKTSA